MLAKTDPEDERAAKRFELYICGVEIANAFEELRDEKEQRRRFDADLEARSAMLKPLYPIDDRFLASLKALPECSGIALGIDRLIMLLTGSQHIDQVITFPEADL